MTIDKAFILKFIKFGTVGSVSFMIDFGTTYFLKEKLKFNKFVANTLGFLISALFNFTCNRLWTFDGGNGDLAAQFSKFISIALFALLLNSLMIYILNVKIRLNFYVSKLIAVVFIMFFNFTMNYIYTFK